MNLTESIRHSLNQLAENAEADKYNSQYGLLYTNGGSQYLRFKTPQARDLYFTALKYISDYTKWTQLNPYEYITQQGKDMWDPEYAKTGHPEDGPAQSEQEQIDRYLKYALSSNTTFVSNEHIRNIQDLINQVRSGRLSPEAIEMYIDDNREDIESESAVFDRY